MGKVLVRLVRLIDTISGLNENNFRDATRSKDEVVFKIGRFLFGLHYSSFPGRIINLKQKRVQHQPRCGRGVALPNRYLVHEWAPKMKCLFSITGAEIEWNAPRHATPRGTSPSIHECDLLLLGRSDFICGSCTERGFKICVRTNLKIVGLGLVSIISFALQPWQWAIYDAKKQEITIKKLSLSTFH